MVVQIIFLGHSQVVLNDYNGHTLVSVGPARRIFEVDLNNEIIWDYTPNTGQGFSLKLKDICLIFK